MTIIGKSQLWFESGKGVKSLFDSELNDPVLDRDDIPRLVFNRKVKRGDKLQELRLRYYSTIDVDYGRLFAGRMEGDLDAARSKLIKMGYRNNPTAYVEVTEDHGPDDGSFARQYVTETGTPRRPYLTNFPSLYRRIKNQVHVVVFQVDDEVHFLAHDEKSAWLQPMRHVTVNNAKASIGVRRFRNDWYDTHGEELGGKEDVKWEVLR